MFIILRHLIANRNRKMQKHAGDHHYENYLPECDYPPSWEGSPQIQKCPLIKKKMTEVRGSAKKHRVLLVNYAIGMKIGMLVPDLLCRHMAMRFRQKCRVKGKERLTTWQWVLDQGARGKGKQKLKRFIKKGETN